MSSLLAPTLADIEARLDKLLQRHADATVLGFHAPARRIWPDSVERQGRRFRLVWCESELELREQLEAVELGEADGGVVVTPLDVALLGSDVVARLPRAQLEESDRWSALRTAFRVHDVDPRLRSHRWLADLLLERMPPAGYPPASGGTLDLDTAWRAVQERLLGLQDGRVDAAALLWWTLDGAAIDRFAVLPAEARQKVAARLGEAGGAAAALVMGAVMAGRGGDALAIGLVCGVVFAEGAPHDALREAAVRLEPFVGGNRLEPAAGAALADAARRILAQLGTTDPAAMATAQTRARGLLTEVRADSYAALSPALGIGFEARVRDAALALSASVAVGTDDAAEDAWNRVEHVAAHDRASDEHARVERLRMAARLCRWLSARPQPARTFAVSADTYASDGGFADRARHALRGGDALPDVAAAYAAVRDAALARREDENRLFAGLLREWNAAGAPGTEPLPIERVLDNVVGPLAREAPVLLLVLDGLSFAVWRELAEALARQGWSELAPRSRPGRITSVAALPTVTEISRASLLSGRLTQGEQATERANFTTHPALVAASAAGHPPRLFHKADLGSGPELGAVVRDAVAEARLRVVGVVHNAVDAQLAGSDQLELVWSTDALRQVNALLHIARDAGRTVIITGDHGHVLEAGTIQRSGGTGSRWRPATSGNLEDGEMRLAGGRLMAPDGAKDVTAAWSERLRYAAKHAGYHGGISPQEVLVPVAVLAAGTPPRGWDGAPPAEPWWWRGDPERAPLPLVAALGLAVDTSLVQRRRPLDARQPELFDTAVVSAAPPLSPAPVAAGITPATPDWLKPLLASDTYAAQRRLAARGAPPDNQLQGLLVVLLARGGRMSRASLAQALGLPVIRVNGLVNAARRVLNVDQAQVLALESEDVILDERMLRMQFSLGGSR